MFNMGTWEMLVVALVVLMFIGPKGIPKLMKDIRGWVKTLRDLSRELTSSFDDMVKDTEFKDAANMLKEARNFNPRNQIGKMLDPDGETEKTLTSVSKEFRQFEADTGEYLNSAASTMKERPLASQRTATTDSPAVGSSEEAAPAQVSAPTKRPNALLEEATDHQEKLANTQS